MSSNEGTTMSRRLSFVLLLGIIVALGLVFLRVMAVFLVPLFLAGVLVVMFRPLHRWLLGRYPGKPRVAAGLTTTAVILTVVLPMAGLLTLAVRDILALQHGDASAATADADLGEPSGVKATIQDQIEKVRQYFELDAAHLNELRYFEATFTKLQERAAAGAMPQSTVVVEAETLDSLVAALADFRVIVADSVNSDRLPDLDRLIEEVEVARGEGPGSLTYQAAVNQAADTFRALQVDLLGGELSMRIKEVANPTEAQLQRLADKAFAGAPDWLRAAGGKTGVLAAQVIFGLVVAVIAVYFFFADGPAMVLTLMRLSPLDDRHERELLEEFDRTSRAVVVATLLTAVVQGLLAGLGFFIIGFWAEGLHAVVFLLTLTTVVFALIPFIGAASVWVPVMLWLLLSGHPWLALVLAGYGMVISSSDNVIKPIVLHGQSNLHPLLALLSVLGGVQALGPIGVLVGPMVVVFMQTLLNILHRELMSLERGDTAPSAE